MSRHTATVCRFHTEVTPSCALDWKELKFHCFGCGAEGTFKLDEHGKFLFTRTNTEEKS